MRHKALKMTTNHSYLQPFAVLALALTWAVAAPAQRVSLTEVQQRITELEAAIAAFPHTVLLVTHDRRLIENTTTTRHWHIERGILTEMS